MADITDTAFLRHLRAAPTSHIRHLSGGTVAHDGIGQSFWFRPLTAAISELPVDDRQLPLVLHARTRDFQDVTVQATLTFRIADPTLAAARVDFGIDPQTGVWRGQPLEALSALLTGAAQQLAIEVIGALELTAAITTGVVAVRERVAQGLGTDGRLAEVGLAIVGVRVAAVRAEPDMERALQTTTRERVQQDADRATYERRATAVNQERAIAENELANQIELARRQEQLVDQEGLNRQREAEQSAAAQAIRSEAEAAERRTRADADAEATRVVGLARADAEAARLAAHRDVAPAVTLALALETLAGQLPSIGTLNLTPDVLAPVLARLGTGS